MRRAGDINVGAFNFTFRAFHAGKRWVTGFLHPRLTRRDRRGGLHRHRHCEILWWDLDFRNTEASISRDPWHPLAVHDASAAWLEEAQYADREWLSAGTLAWVKRALILRQHAADMPLSMRFEEAESSQKKKPHSQRPQPEWSRT